MKLCEIVCLRESFSFSDTNRVCERRSNWECERVEQGDLGLLKRMSSSAFANTFDHSEDAFTADQRNRNDELSAFLSLDRAQAGCSAFRGFRFRTDGKLGFRIQQPSPVFFGPVFLSCFSNR